MQVTVGTLGLVGDLPSASLRLRHPRRCNGEEANFTICNLKSDEGYGLSYPDGTEFLVDAGGRQIAGKWEEPWTIEDFTTYLVGPVMGFVLRRRGVLALHASGVAIGGRAVLFCGAAGAGKSTLAAALALRGLSVLCEDIAALRWKGDMLSVAPGYPRVCLWPDSVARLSASPEQCPVITPNWDKRYLPLDGKLAYFCSEPLPVSAIYVLTAREDSDRAPSIGELRAKDAIPLLVENTYMNYLLDRAQRAQEFEQLAQVVASVPVRLVIPHADFDRVDELCELILSDSEKIASRETATPRRS